MNVPIWKSDMNKCIGGRYVIVLYQRHKVVNVYIVYIYVSRSHPNSNLWTWLIQTLQVGGVLESSEPPLDDGHRDF